jgi:hypothetical protein
MQACHVAHLRLELSVKPLERRPVEGVEIGKPVLWRLWALFHKSVPAPSTAVGVGDSLEPDSDGLLRLWIYALKGEGSALVVAVAESLGLQQASKIIMHRPTHWLFKLSLQGRPYHAAVSIQRSFSSFSSPSHISAPDVPHH